MDSAKPRPILDALMWVHVAAVAALAVFAVVLARTYCEGFGCIGRGIAWFAWSCGYAAALALGGVLRLRMAGRLRWRRAQHAALVVQLALGAALAAFWLVRRLAFAPA